MPRPNRQQLLRFLQAFFLKNNNWHLIDLIAICGSDQYEVYYRAERTSCIMQDNSKNVQNNVSVTQNYCPTRLQVVKRDTKDDSSLFYLQYSQCRRNAYA